MVIVDTTVWIDFLRGIQTQESDWLNSQMHARRIGLTRLNFSEVFQGIRETRKFEEIRDEFLSRFYVFETGKVELSILAARNYRKLREIGYTVRKTIDCMIATFCIEAGHELLHRDRDFDAFEKALDLRVIHPQ